MRHRAALRAALARLEASGYRTLSPTRLADGTVAEHVAIGPAGVFVVRTSDTSGRARARRKRLQVDRGDRHHELALVRAPADAIRRQLWRRGMPVDVVPVLVVERAPRRRLRFADTWVVDAAGIERLLGTGEHLDVHDVARCLSALATSTVVRLDPVALTL